MYNKVHMGNCAEICASEMNFSREQQDVYRIIQKKYECGKQGNSLMK